MGIESLVVFIGGSLGAVCRYAVSLQMKRILSTEFPMATFLINLVGSFLLGLLLTFDFGSLTQLIFGTGFLGGFTTFSTFQLENVALFQKKNYRTLVIYMAASVGLCVISASLGFGLGIWVNN